MKILTLIIALGLLVSCSCPADQKIGTVKLDPVTLSYFPYTGQEKLIFKNRQGQTIKFYAPQGLTNSKTKIAVYKRCSEFKFDGKTTYKYYEGQGKKIWFKSDNGYAINLGLFTENLKPEQVAFYDKLTVDLMKVGGIGRMELVTKVRLKNHNENDIYLTDKAIRVGNIKLVNKTFHDVWSSKNFDGRILYYNKIKGIVGFNDGEHLYYLDEIER